MVGPGSTDGLDLDDCQRVHVVRCDIATGDDAIACKSSAGGVTEHVLIEHTTLRRKVISNPVDQALHRIALL